jgi:hypothetical protein
MSKKKAPEGNCNNEEMKDSKNYPKMKDELTYFLDHPDIKREECIGNQASPGTQAAPAKPFGNVGQAVTRGTDSSAQMKQGQQKHAAGRGFGKMMGNLFGKKP